MLYTSFSIMDGTQTCTWIPCSLAHAIYFCKTQQLRHPINAWTSTDTVDPNCHPPPGQQSAPPLQTPLSPLLSSPFPANPRLALKPQMQKLIACVKQFWHELVLKKPFFLWSSAPVNFCSPNDHFGPFSCPIKKNTKFVPKPPSCRRRPNSPQIPSKLTP